MIARLCMVVVLLGACDLGDSPEDFSTDFTLAEGVSSIEIMVRYLDVIETVALKSNPSWKPEMKREGYGTYEASGSEYLMACIDAERHWLLSQVGSQAQKASLYVLESRRLNASGQERTIAVRLMDVAQKTPVTSVEIDNEGRILMKLRSPNGTGPYRLTPPQPITELP
jgi:hypothetical protein